MKLHEHILSDYDVKLVGSEPEVERYRRDFAEMVWLLRELEWDHAECNICFGVHKHEPGCRLESTLQRVRNYA